MTSTEIRIKFLEFFKKRGHTILPSASLVPENDPTVLFNTAGMQPLVPYLMGAKHPSGDKLADVQKCVRTGDIDDIGDNTHATFFEMLGNWSLGSYFKEDAIKWSFELLTSQEGFGLDPKRLYVTVFEGDENAPRDTEAFEIWKKVGMPENRIYFKGADSNWWPAVKGKDTWTGPTGPCSEMFYDITEEGLGDLTEEQYIAADESQKIVEIWNDVFMEYEKKDGKIVSKLATKNVDTGAGLERITAVIQKKNNIFDTDLFEPIMVQAKQIASNLKAQRIIADHFRASVFLIADGVTPSNTDQGYVLRRLIRRAVVTSTNKKIDAGNISTLVDSVVDKYGTFSDYKNLETNRATIKHVLQEEVEKFEKTLRDGLKQFEKLSQATISGKDAFILFSTYGFPLEITIELAKEKGIAVDEKEFEEELKKHQNLSRSGSEKKFKGGLGDTSEMSLKYHTATHLLNAALHKVLGNHVSQKGSNITPERLRFDFSHGEKMTDDQKKQVEALVNGWIKEDYPVTFTEMPKAEAEKVAIHAFGDKYGDIVKVYSIGTEGNYISREFCGGPHVTHTGILGHFKIQKEEAVSQGVRRIKAVLI